MQLIYLGAIHADATLAQMHLQREGVPSATGTFPVLSSSQYFGIQEPAFYNPRGKDSLAVGMKARSRNGNAARGPK